MHFVLIDALLVIQKTTEESRICLLSLKAVLKDAIPTVPIEVKAMGTIYLIYSDRGGHVISELANEAVNDHLQFPNATIIDKIHGDIIKQVYNPQYSFKINRFN